MASVFKHFAHYNTSYVTCDRYFGLQLITFFMCTKRTAKRLAIRTLFRALKSSYIEDNKADVSTTFTKNAESLARNGEVVARGGFQVPAVN